MNEIALSENLEILTDEILSFGQHVNKSYWEIGRRLSYIKENKLNHGEFLNYLETIKIQRDEAYKLMSIGKMSNIASLQHLPKTNLFIVSTIPETERSVVIEKGIPTENGMKKISEATVREIETYKKQLKQKDERINALESAEPRVIEKRVEVPPSDYYSLKQANESLTDELLRTHEQIKQIESRESLLKIQYDLLESESREAKELKIHIDSLRDERESINNQIKLLTEFNEKTGKLKQVFDSELASLRFRPYVNELSSTEATNRLWELVDSISFWVDEMNKMRPNDNMKIIEGELL